LQIIAVAAVATAFATAASAQSTTLVRPSQAESLKSGGVSMTVYYLARSKPIEVVATFGERKSARPASQLRMSLLDGDDIEFIIPGRPDVSFQFARSGSLIEVRSNPSDARSPATN
jgi:hypothetical protein